MSSITLDCPREDAKALVKLAFENTPGVKTYHDAGTRIEGKTGASLGSYGENVIVEVPANQADDGRTVIMVRAEKEVDMNITANPDKYKSRFLDALDHLRGRPVEDVLDENVERISAETTKEVATRTEQTDGKDLLYVVIAITLIIMFFMMFMPFLMMP